MTVLRQGSVVRAWVNDPQGGNPKCRPLIVITPTKEIGDGLIAVVAITGEFADPPAHDEIPLPFDPTGKAKTGLRKPSVAKCSWQEAVAPADVVDDGKQRWIPSQHLTLILEKIAELDAAVDASSEAGNG
jgi:hypothetical protein